MEVSGMDETKKSENHLTSAAAFVEGGIQDACDDACSICLEAFCDSDPSTVTSCKHEFHLQCILEWCQRSSQCPMCWQPISLKDPTSQELLEAVEHERKLRFNPPRNATIFHHPAFGEFELQHLPVGANDSELEERIIQHLAAAAMGRSHHMARREGQRSRSTAHGRPQFLVFSTNPNASSTGPASSHPDLGDGDNGPAPSNTATGVSSPMSSVREEPSQGIPQLLPAQTEQSPTSASGSRVLPSNQSRITDNSRNSTGQSSPVNQDRAGPSELQSLSESLKSRLSAVSTKYKESITKSTRGWKERLFSRNTSMSDLSSEVKREVNAGIASVSRLMERLDTRENSRVTGSSVSDDLVDSVSETGVERIPETHASHPMNTGNTSPSCPASSGQN
ncbi:E3 ubiquitin-protein ligase rhf2a-like protein [Thalictrum thalictroides]|uniref:RING-type E3 ubiquitin transferase n=1 Tax=Thalictrum thalictroides TaxID=46969 RepID=A0A7J6V2G5_THATH|nr:E3 ubiquitin-protein ligase rhf2a-like protein [Thalictrum thalictroides]